VIDMASLELIKVIKTGKNGNRLYLNPANARYGIFTNESGKSETVSVIDTQADVKIKDIETGLGPHMLLLIQKEHEQLFQQKRRM
jgi:DNA-binding beta-propeller fold protein YncE